MPTFLALFAPLALFVPGISDVPADERAKLLPEPVEESGRDVRDVPAGWLMLDATTSIPIQHQVRIERRVIIRVSPRSPAQRRELVATLAPNGGSQYVERPAGKCIPVNSIAAVQATRDNRLLLYLRQGGMMAASLEKSCRARDFYSGFVVEPNGDGKLCIGRDKLQSRTGVKCAMSGLRQLVPVTAQ